MYYYKLKNGNSLIALKDEMSKYAEFDASKYDAISESKFNSLKKQTPTEFTPNNDAKISILKAKLRDTDYMAIKYAEGVLNEAEYAEIKAQRQTWREEINELEKEIK